MRRADATGEAPGFSANLAAASRFADEGLRSRAVALYVSVARVSEVRNDFGTALTAYRCAVRLEPKGSKFAVKVGEMELRLGRCAAASATLDRASLDCLQAGRVLDGLRALRLAAIAEPTSDRIADMLQWHRHHDRTSEAMSALDDIGKARFAEGAYREFVAVALQRLATTPLHLATLRRLMRAHLHLREVRRAADVVHRILAARPGDPDALECMAELLEVRGRREHAVELLMRLAEHHAKGGEAGRAEAVRLVVRGLQWKPDHEGMQRLAVDLGVRPGRARGSSPGAGVRPLDLTDFMRAAESDRPSPDGVSALAV